MNVRIGRGIAVHLASRSKGVVYGAQCNNDGWVAGKRVTVTETDDAVTCKKCLKRESAKIDQTDDLTSVQDTTNVILISNDDTEVTEMRTYADYLATMTVKTLNTIAKDMGITGYSKLRKASLVQVIDAAIGALDVRWESAEMIRGWHTIALDMNNPKVNTVKAEILSVDRPADHKRIASIMSGIASAPRKVAPVTFSHTPAKPAESAPKAVKTLTTAPTNPYAEDSTDDLIDAIRYMRPVLHKATGERHIRIAGQVRDMYAVLKGRKVNVREV